MDPEVTGTLPFSNPDPLPAGAALARGMNDESTPLEMGKRPSPPVRPGKRRTLFADRQVLLAPVAIKRGAATEKRAARRSCGTRVLTLFPANELLFPANDSFPVRNDSFPGGNDSLPVRSKSFAVGNAAFAVGNELFPGRDKLFRMPNKLLSGRDECGRAEDIGLSTED